RHALAMLAEADAALEAVEFARAEPRGAIKVSAPIDLSQTTMTRLLPEFLVRYPKVRVLLQSTNRRVDVLNEGFDVAFRVRTKPTGEDGLVLRTFGQSQHVLVATRAYLDQRGHPSTPADLAQHSTLSFELENQIWELQDSSGVAVRIEHTPRLVC